MQVTTTVCSPTLSALLSGSEAKMHRAAKVGDTAKVVELIESGTSVNAEDSLQATVLYWASSKHHEDLVEVLLRKGANVNARTKWGSTPLHAAADRGYHRIAQLLVSHGADCNAKNDNDDAPLHAAAARGHMDIVQLLIFNGGADLNARNLQRRTPHDEAEHAGMIDVARFLAALMNNAERISAFHRSLPGFELSVGSDEREDNGGGCGAVKEQRRPDSSRSETHNDNQLQKKIDALIANREAVLRENEAIQEELVKTKDDLGAVKLKLKSCQDRLEEKSAECECLQAKLWSISPSEKMKYSSGVSSPPPSSFQSVSVLATLVGCVALSHFPSAQLTLASCVAMAPEPAEELRIRIANKAGGFWLINRDYEIIGAGPIQTGFNFAFRIRHVKFGVFILKMLMNNLIETSHRHLYSGFNAAFRPPVDSSIPLIIPPSPYLLPVLHRFKGPATAFSQYTSSLVLSDPHATVDFSRTAEFLVLPEFETTLENWISHRPRRRHVDQRFADSVVSESECLLLLFQVLSGVRALANSGVAHRNLRPSCILLNGWRAVIADFSVAKRVAENGTYWKTSLRDDGGDGGGSEDTSLSDVYAKSDLCSVGRLFLNVFQSEGDSLSLFSSAFRNLLANLVSGDRRIRIDVRTAVAMTALMLWCETELRNEEDAARWILKELFEAGVDESTRSSGISAAEESFLAGLSLSAKQLDGELKKRFLCEATSECTWRAYEALRVFRS
eukprot:m.17524 g.17524  ORF g.17524 m.17524 type:complete len:731 (+) comp27512_c0_seq1:848-3040(+)